jgi:hypothetical protein
VRPGPSLVPGRTGPIESRSHGGPRSFEILSCSSYCQRTGSSPSRRTRVRVPKAAAGNIAPTIRSNIFWRRLQDRKWAIFATRAADGSGSEQAGCALAQRRTLTQWYAPLPPERILNELAAARLCLLNPVKKAKYDDDLRVGQAFPLDAGAAPVRPILLSAVVPAPAVTPVAPSVRVRPI